MRSVKRIIAVLLCMGMIFSDSPVLSAIAQGTGEEIGNSLIQPSDNGSEQQGITESEEILELDVLYEKEVDKDSSYSYQLEITEEDDYIIDLKADESQELELQVQVMDNNKKLIEDIYTGDDISISHCLQPGVYTILIDSYNGVSGNYSIIYKKDADQNQDEGKTSGEEIGPKDPVEESFLQEDEDQDLSDDFEVDSKEEIESDIRLELAEPQTTDTLKVQALNSIDQSTVIGYDSWYYNGFDEDGSNNTQYYAITAPYKGTYTVQVNGSSSDLTYHVGISNSLNQLITYNRGSTVTVETTIDAGIYYIAVRRLTSTASGSYSLRVTKTSQDLEGDTPATATKVSYDQTYNFGIDYATDVDYFEFTAPYKGTYTVDVATKAGASGERINAYCWFFDAQNRGVGNYARGTDIRNQVTVEAGTHYIKIYKYSGTDVGDYSLRLTKTKEDFEGDTAETAKVIEYDQTYNCSINYATDVDYFKFIAPYKGTYTVDVATKAGASGEKINAYCWFFDAQNRGIGSWARGTDIRNEVTVEAGIYYIKIYKYSGTDIGDYSLRLAKTNQDLEGDTLETAKIIDYDQIYDCSIDYTTDVDYFKFVAPHRGTYTVDIEAKEDDLGEQVSVYCWFRDGKDGGIGSYARGAKFKNEITVDAGIYYIRLNRYSGSNIGDYTLKLTKTKEDLEGDTLETARIIEYDQSYDCSINYTTDVDYFKFVAPHRGTYTVDFEAKQDTLGEQVSVYCWFRDGKDGVLSSYARGTKFSNEITVDPGTYYIRINRYSGSSIGDYSLRLTKTNADREGNTAETAKVIGFDKIYECSIDYISDIDYFVIEVPYKGTYTIDIQADQRDESNPFKLQGWLMNADDIYYTGYWKGSIIQDEITLEAGTYYVKAQRFSGTNVGDYTIRVTGTRRDLEANNVDMLGMQEIVLNSGYSDVVSGEINYIGDVDIFRFVVNETDEYRIITSSINIKTRFLGFEGRYLTDSKSIILKPGIYYIQVNAAVSGAYREFYSFQLENNDRKVTIESRKSTYSDFYHYTIDESPMQTMLFQMTLEEQYTKKEGSDYKMWDYRTVTIFTDRTGKDIGFASLPILRHFYRDGTEKSIYFDYDEVVKKEEYPSTMYSEGVRLISTTALKYEDYCGANSVANITVRCEGSNKQYSPRTEVSLQ